MMEILILVILKTEKKIPVQLINVSPMDNFIS